MSSARGDPAVWSGDTWCGLAEFPARKCYIAKSVRTSVVVTPAIITAPSAKG